MKKMAMAWLLSGIALGGCGAQDVLDATAPAEGVDNTETIKGGVVDTGDPAVVALYGKKPGEDKGVLCTSTVIAPKVVLMAAHCVHPDTAGTGLDFNVLLAPDLTDPNKPSPRVHVKEVHYDPMFDAKNLPGGHDIAVALLDEAVTITPIPWNRAALAQSLVGQPARIVGYGLNDGFGQKGAGIKRQATVKLNSFDNNLVKTGNFFKGICSGDSGGPVLMKINNKETVVGVNSFGLIFCLGEGLSTRVDRYVSFVDQYLK